VETMGGRFYSPFFSRGQRRRRFSVNSSHGLAGGLARAAAILGSATLAAGSAGPLAASMRRMTVGEIT
jgi:hypothetical protein